jgi:RNA polymerase sigma-70 factor (ECF subfamily)
LFAAERRFRDLFERCYAPVLAYALRRAADSADDVVAETFLVAWRRREEVPVGDGELPWLFATARRVLANQRRSSFRAKQLVRRLEESYSEPDTHDTSDVLGAVANLGATDREVLLLSAWEGLSYRQIAAIFSCSENAVALRVQRARRRLEAELIERTTTRSEVQL